MTAVVARRRVRPLVDQGGVRHTRSRRHALPGVGGGPEQEVGGAGQEAGSSSPAVRSRAISGLVLPGRPGPVGRRPHREVRAVVDRLARHATGPGRGDGLRQRLGEGRGEAQDAPAPADEVEARHVAGEHGRMTLLRVQLDPGPQQHPRHRRAPARRPGRWGRPGPLAQEHGGCTLGLGPGRPPHAARPCHRPGGTVLPRRGRLGRQGPPTESGAEGLQGHGLPRAAPPVHARSHHPPASWARPAWASRSRPPHSSARSRPVSRASSSRGAGSAVRAS